MCMVLIEYFTDPLCSYCYAFEPVLDRLIREHGDELDLVTHFGGLLPNWDGFLDPANGISSPRDVAEHWEHVGKLTGVPIKGDVWRTDPVESSYPASIACFAARAFGEEKAALYLRKVREKAFVACKNIAKESVLLEVAEEVQISSSEFIREFHNPAATLAFEADLRYTAEKNVQAFPTLLFYGASNILRLQGFLPYEQYVEALHQAKDR